MCARAIPTRDPADPQDDPGALEEPESHRGSAYPFAVAGGACTARRRDGEGGTLTAPLPDGLRLLILADYAAMPVPGNLP